VTAGPNERPAVVVITPLRDDSWILRRFLEVCSVFADRIVVALQQSAETTRKICREFEKVQAIEDPIAGYDESRRQELLIRAARELVPGPRILLALDPDEILAANAMSTRGWQAMLAAAPGTVIFFERPNLYFSPRNCERRPLDFAAGFVDDGVAVYEGPVIHAPRVPKPPDAPQLTLGDVKFLHYARLRPEAEKAEMRMYAALENVLGTMPLLARRRAYWSRRSLRPEGSLEPTPREWFEAWESRGIDMTTIQDVRPYWQDLATLELLLEHGSRRFWFDDVWGKDWNALIVELGRLARVDPPPRLLRFAVDNMQRLAEWIV
jgi:hypothetical protein